MVENHSSFSACCYVIIKSPHDDLNVMVGWRNAILFKFLLILVSFYILYLCSKTIKRNKDIKNF